MKYFGLRLVAAIVLFASLMYFLDMSRSKGEANPSHARDLTKREMKSVRGSDAICQDYSFSKTVVCFCQSPWANWNINNFCAWQGCAYGNCGDANGRGLVYFNPSVKDVILLNTYTSATQVLTTTSVQCKSTYTCLSGVADPNSYCQAAVPLDVDPCNPPAGWPAANGAPGVCKLIPPGGIGYEGGCTRCSLGVLIDGSAVTQAFPRVIDCPLGE